MFDLEKLQDKLSDNDIKLTKGLKTCLNVGINLLKTEQSILEFEKSWFDEHAIAKPNMANFLDIVALGTVADVVPLDQNNRILVHQGIRRIRAKRCTPGIQALLEVAKRSIHSMGASDLGFAIGPRLAGTST